MAAEQQGVDQVVGPVELVAEFEAEVIHIDVDAPVFELYDVDDGTPVGEMQLQPDRLSGWLDDVGDRAYVTVQMEYDHGWTVDVLTERLGEPKGAVERRREGTKEMFEEWEEEYL